MERHRYSKEIGSVKLHNVIVNSAGHMKLDIYLKSDASSAASETTEANSVVPTTTTTSASAALPPAPAPMTPEPNEKSSNFPEEQASPQLAINPYIMGSPKLHHFTRSGSGELSTITKGRNVSESSDLVLELTRIGLDELSPNLTPEISPLPSHKLIPGFPIKFEVQAASKFLVVAPTEVFSGRSFDVVLQDGVKPTIHGHEHASQTHTGEPAGVSHGLTHTQGSTLFLTATAKTASGDSIPVDFDG